MFSWRGVDAATGRVVVSIIKLCVEGPHIDKFEQLKTLLKQWLYTDKKFSHSATHITMGRIAKVI
jgi:hypothetical protein